jgi:hypothetical protein
MKECTDRTGQVAHYGVGNDRPQSSPAGSNSGEYMCLLMNINETALMLGDDAGFNTFWTLPDTKLIINERMGPGPRVQVNTNVG